MLFLEHQLCPFASLFITTSGSQLGGKEILSSCWSRVTEKEFWSNITQLVSDHRQRRHEPEINPSYKVTLFIYFLFRLI